MSRRGNPREGGKGQTGRGPIVPETDHKVPGTQRDFSVREQLAIAGATEYFAKLIPVGMATEAFPGSGVA